jgi:hypothetical protein
LIFWFKPKDPEEGGKSYAICLFAPEKADSPAKAEAVRETFEVIRREARRTGCVIFDAKALNDEMGRFMEEAGSRPAAVGRDEDITIFGTDMVSGRKVSLTLAVRRIGNAVQVQPPKMLSG